MVVRCSYSSFQKFVLQDDHRYHFCNSVCCWSPIFVCFRIFAEKYGFKYIFYILEVSERICEILFLVIFDKMSKIQKWPLIFGHTVYILNKVAHFNQNFNSLLGY